MSFRLGSIPGISSRRKRFLGADAFVVALLVAFPVGLLIAFLVVFLAAPFMVILEALFAGFLMVLRLHERVLL